MGPSESVTRPRRLPTARRRFQPRARRCLLKGCGEQHFHPRQARQRYCSAECREKARQWSRWKAQQKYRKTARGKQNRTSQSERYRERVKSRKLPEAKDVSEPARVITKEQFFRTRLRPARLLRAIRTTAAKSLAALLLCSVPSRAGTRAATGTALETGAHLSRTY